MKRLLLSSLLAAIGLSASATAQNADVYIVHGINGIDLQSNEDFPVDIQLNDAPLLAGVPFRARTDAYELAPGTYNIKISPADPNNPYSQPPVIDVDVDFLADTTYSVIAHLDENFGATASVFVHDLANMPNLTSRVGIRHTAAAPAVDVLLESAFPFIDDVFVPGATNGVQAEADLAIGFWKLTLFAAGTSDAIFTPLPRLIRPDRYFSVFFVGSLTNGTFEALVYSDRM